MMKKALLMLCILSAIAISGCSKKVKCDYEGFDLKKNKQYGCHYEISGDIVTVDDSFCDCE